MKLSHSTAVIRPRRGWEAIDLGVRMIQRDFVALARRWIVATLPWYVMFLSAGHLFGSVGLGVLLFWWMKPAFDRVILDYLSQRLFSPGVQDPGPFDLWFRLPFSAAAWRQLTYLRFSLARTFTLPVYQLEGASGNSGERIRTLVNRDYGASAWLTVVFFFLSSTLLTVILAQLTHWLHPEPIILQDANIFDRFLETEELFTGPLLWLHMLMYYLVTGLFELFFVGAGFALYLNRRTHLEAWDIELSFRRLSERLSRGTTTLATITAAILCVALSVISPTEIQAQETPAAPDSSYELPSTEQARQTVKEIYAGDEFGEQINDRVWRLKETDEDTTQADSDMLRSIGPIIALFAKLLKYLLIAVVVIAIVVWFIKERKRLLQLKSPAKKVDTSNDVIEAEEEQLFVPDADVPEVVRKLWEEGKARESLSYLYRSALSFLVTRHELLIGDHATEEDCLQLVRANASEQVSLYFSDITRQWRLLAYGKRKPEDSMVSDLCARWTQLADIPSRASVGTATSA
ncbi:MAG: hypothetical protein AB8G18_00390 [Gammaproteobacteria bacterium]